MKYAISPFDVALQENGSGSLRCVAGTFVVEDENIGRLLSSLKDFHIISEDELKEIVKKLTPHSYGDVLKYLINTTSILRSFVFEKDVVVDADRKNFEFLSTCLIQGLDIKMFNEDSLIKHRLCDSSGSIFVSVVNHKDDCSKIDRIKKIMSDHDIMIVLIFVDCFAIITPPYSKKSSLPCPICCYDFATEQSFFDSHNRGMSLGDAAEILLNQGTPLYQNSLVKDRDRLFAMRFLAYRLEIFTGL